MTDPRRTTAGVARRLKLCAVYGDSDTAEPAAAPPGPVAGDGSGLSADTCKVTVHVLRNVHGGASVVATFSGHDGVTEELLNNEGRLLYLGEILGDYFGAAIHELQGATST